MATGIALSTHQALRSLYNAGHNTEPKLKAAHIELQKLPQPAEGYYYADKVHDLIVRLAKAGV